MCAREASYSPEVSWLLGAWVLRPWSSRSRIDHPTPLASTMLRIAEPSDPPPPGEGGRIARPVSIVACEFSDCATYPPPAGEGKSAASPDRHPAADGAVQHLRGLLDPLGGGVQGVGDRG